jgi:hypothetical protein
MKNSTNKKIFILLPDGIGLRNFAFTNFHKMGLEKEFDVTFWNTTPFNLDALGFRELKIENPRIHPLTEFYKNAQIQIELNQNIIKAKDTIYNSYRFSSTNKNIKSFIKNSVLKWIIFFNNSPKGLNRIKDKINLNERKTKLYFDSLEILKQEKPALVFCTNQTITTAVAPILAAQDLGIPTASFIFSWDNLPKGIKIIATDFYFVWSEHMKNELQYYYPDIKGSQIFITGTPQFEPHYEKQFLITKEVFFNQNGLDLSKKYICFSGDDVTTSPNDPHYLLDVVKAVEQLNAKGHNLGIIFRRCPVDFSNRYDFVSEKYNDIIVCIAPLWKNIGDTWSTVLPTKEDLILQMNTIYHSEFVVNLGSSMVFDFAALQKPCFYINYNSKNKKIENWNSQTIYNFVHFRSMPNKECVFWINNPDEIEDCIIKGMGNEAKNVIDNAKKWFEIINQHPPEKASERIWDAIEMILKK